MFHLRELWWALWASLPVPERVFGQHSGPKLCWFCKTFYSWDWCESCGFGAVWSQEVDGKRKPNAFASMGLRRLEGNMSNYSARQLLLLVLKWEVTDKFRKYLFGNKSTSLIIIPWVIWKRLNLLQWSSAGWQRLQRLSLKLNIVSAPPIKMQMHRLDSLHMSPVNCWPSALKYLAWSSNNSVSLRVLFWTLPLLRPSLSSPGNSRFKSASGSQPCCWCI